MGCCKSKSFKNNNKDIHQNTIHQNITKDNCYVDIDTNMNMNMNISSENNIGLKIINLYKNQKQKQTQYNYIINLNRSIKLYEYEKERNNNLDLDYITKCIIVLSFIRDIDKVLNDLNDIKNLQLPIFIIELLESYKNNSINNEQKKYIEWMSKFDEIENIEINKSENQQLNIIIGLINSIYVI